MERFVAVGETIGDENPDIQPELYDACHEARIAGIIEEYFHLSMCKFSKGSSIANLHSSMLTDPLENGGVNPLQQQSAPSAVVDSAQLVRAARQLLSSVTRYRVKSYALGKAILSV